MPPRIAGRPPATDVLELPLEGVPESLAGFVVAEDGGRVIGVAGIEDCGEYGLLRSAAVDSAARSRGVGRAMVERLITDARSDSRKALFLLTNTAEGYFPAFGFEEISRDDVPGPIRATREFSDACPASATVMRLELRQ